MSSIISHVLKFHVLDAARSGFALTGHDRFDSKVALTLQSQGFRCGPWKTGGRVFVLPRTKTKPWQLFTDRDTQVITDTLVLEAVRALLPDNRTRLQFEMMLVDRITKGQVGTCSAFDATAFTLNLPGKARLHNHSVAQSIMHVARNTAKAVALNNSDTINGLPKDLAERLLRLVVITARQLSKTKH